MDTSEAQASPATSVRSYGSGRRVKFALPADDMLEKKQSHQPPSPATRPARSALKGGEHQHQLNNLQFIGNILFMDTGDLARSSAKPGKQRAERSDADPVRFSCISCSFSWLGQEDGTAHCPKCWQPLFSADKGHEVTKQRVPLAS